MKDSEDKDKIQKNNSLNEIPTYNEIYASLCKRHTKAVQDRISSGRVAVAGLGGLGSVIATALARAGVGHLHLIDFDRVDLSNLNRQQYRLCDIGKYKTEALLEILEEINPYLDIKIDSIKIDKCNIKYIFENDNIVCEAFDDAVSKALFVDGFFTYYKSGVLISSSGMAGLGSGNDIITRKINDRFYICGDGKNGLESGQQLFAPHVGICACHQANMVLRLLTGMTGA